MADVLIQLVAYLFAILCAVLAILFLAWGVTYHVRARRDYMDELRRTRRELDFTPPPETKQGIHWKP